MKILYHLTVLPPKMPECEALSQEIATLRRHFEGNLIYLNPNIASPIYIPRLLFGFHKLKHLRVLEKNIDLHHVYNPDPFPFPILKRLRRPIVYSITSGVGHKKPNLAFLSSLAAVAVPDERSLKRLQNWGLNNVFLTRAGINTNRFTHTPLPVESKIWLMVGSAPWTKAQFDSKGVNALLETARLNPQIHLVFLWRGILADEMESRVKRLNLDSQVQVINRQVDVNQVLARVHASVALASAPGIIKSYPHSLLDSLAAGKPVIVSRAIPMADYVEEIGCGTVVESVDAPALAATVQRLVKNYSDYQAIAQKVGRRDFSEQRMVDSFQELYDHIIKQDETQKKSFDKAENL